MTMMMLMMMIGVMMMLMMTKLMQLDDMESTIDKNGANQTRDDVKHKVKTKANYIE